MSKAGLNTWSVTSFLAPLIWKRKASIPDLSFEKLVAWLSFWIHWHWWLDVFLDVCSIYSSAFCLTTSNKASCLFTLLVKLFICALYLMNSPCACIVVSFNIALDSCSSDHSSLLACSNSRHCIWTFLHSLSMVTKGWIYTIYSDILQQIHCKPIDSQSVYEGIKGLSSLL